MAVEIDSEGEPVLDSEVNSEDEVNSSASLSEAESDSDDGQLMAVEIDSELDSEVDSEDEVSSSVSLSEAESDSDDGQLMAVEIDSEREPVLDSEVHSKDEENTNRCGIRLHSQKKRAITKFEVGTKYYWCATIRCLPTFPKGETSCCSCATLSPILSFS
ncbi:hypothetical protein GW17_00018158 [Ensete ventricosum]|nr:hypothetical protein GW17_00018158 [Ensete ventricosum]